MITNMCRLSQDMLGSLKPQLAHHANFEQACQAVAAIEPAEAAAAEAAGMPIDYSDSNGGTPEVLPAEVIHVTHLAEQMLRRMCWGT